MQALKAKKFLFLIKQALTPFFLLKRKKAVFGA